MKTTIASIVSLCLTIAIAPTAFAEGKTYTGTATYSAPWNDVRPSFSDLEQLGVEKAAEQNAVQNCAADGKSVCYILSSAITYCNVEVNGPNEIDCSAKATVLSPSP